MNGADLAVLVVPFLDGSSNRVEAGTDLEVSRQVLNFFADHGHEGRLRFGVGESPNVEFLFDVGFLVSVSAGDGE